MARSEDRRASSFPTRSMPIGVFWAVFVFEHPIAYTEVGCFLPQGGEVIIYILWWRLCFAHRYSSHRLSGVLFLDELPEFPRRVLEALRQPLEDERVSISRAGAAVTFPSKFMLVAAMNPCPCGYLGDPVHKCTCTEHQIRQYAARISGPLTDRIDMRVEILPVGYNELCGEEKNPVRRKTSAAFRNEVEAARMLQTERYRGEAISCNSQLTPALLKKYCPLDSTCRELLRNAFEKFGLSARSHQKVIKIARTIADLSGSEKIDYFHLAEALRYRTGRNGEC